MKFTLRDMFPQMNKQDQSYADSESPIIDLVRSRTIELALIAGRSPVEIRQRDYEQAKRELTGETDFDRQLAVLYQSY